MIRKQFCGVCNCFCAFFCTCFCAFPTCCCAFAHADQSVPGMAHTVADLLSELILVPPASLYGAPQHQAELKPITWAAQMCNGLEKRDKAVLMPSADSVWRPTCLSIGPAPVATAGAESVYNLAAFIQLAPDLIPPVIVVDCLRLTVQLTTLARRMAHEASGAER
jgi:hypothetical protein